MIPNFRSLKRLIFPLRFIRATLTHDQRICSGHGLPTSVLSKSSQVRMSSSAERKTVRAKPGGHIAARFVWTAQPDQLLRVYITLSLIFSISSAGLVVKNIKNATVNAKRRFLGFRFVSLKVRRENDFLMDPRGSYHW